MTNEPAFPQQIDIEFDASLQTGGVYATYLTVPGSAEALGTGRAVKVTGSTDGHEFSATLMPSGTGPHWLPPRAAICEAIGKRGAGEPVHVHLTVRHS